MLVDPRLGDDYDIGQLKRLSFSASLCIRATAKFRPSMTEVIPCFYQVKIRKLTSVRARRKSAMFN